MGVARKVPSSRSRADCLFLVRDFLAPLPQLTSCSREVLLELAREVTLAEYEAGQVMLAQGDVSRAVMVIMTGAADAYRTVAIPLLTATGPERGSEGGGGASGGPAVPPLEVGVSQIMSESSLTLMQQPSYIGALVEQYGKWQASYGPGAMLGDLDAMGPTAGGGGGGGGGRGGSSSNARPANLSTVVAIRPVVALVISNDVYNRTVRLMRSTELKQRLTLLKMMPVLASSHRSAVINAANAVVPVEVPRGAALQREGDKFKGIHFIMSGMATVLLGQAAASGAGAAGGVVAAGESPTWRPQGGGHIGGDGAAGPRIMVREVGVLGELDCFGEDGMLTNVHSVCVVAATPCKLLLLKATDVIILGERGIRSLHAVAQMKEEWRARRLESAAVAGQAVAVPRWRTRGVGRPGPPQAQLFSAVPPAAQRLARATADALPWAGNRGLKAAQPGMDERTGDSIADSSVPLSKASWTLHPEGRSEAEASEGMSTTFEPAGAFKRNMMFFKAWAGAIGQDAALSSLLQVEQESAEASHRAAAVLADRSMRAIPGSVQLASAYEDITTHANVAAIESFNASRRSTQFAGLKWEARADSAVSTSSASGLQPPADASSGAASGAAAAETIAAAAPAELYVSTSDVLGRRREARRTVGDLPQTPYKLRASNAFVLSELFPGEAVTVGVSEPRHAPRGTQHQQPAGKR